MLRPCFEAARYKSQILTTGFGQEILVHGPETVNGKTYPETVLFRMADQNMRPIVKFTASANGSALGLSDDSEGGRVQLNAKGDTGNFVKVVNKDGREQVIKP